MKTLKISLFLIMMGCSSQPANRSQVTYQDGSIDTLTTPYASGIPYLIGTSLVIYDQRVIANNVVKYKLLPR